MSMKFKTAAVALVIAASSLTLGCMSDRDGRYGRDYRENGAVSVDFGSAPGLSL